MSLTPVASANCLATSVFPTPVGPENKYEPTGFSTSLNPALDNLILETNSVTALSCPYTILFKSSSNFDSAFLSSVDTFLGGILAINATVSSISVFPIIFFLLDLAFSICAAAVSSITSIALSGNFLSLIYLEDSSTAVLIAILVNFNL